MVEKPIPKPNAIKIAEEDISQNTEEQRLTFAKGLAKSTPLERLYYLQGELRQLRDSNTRLESENSRLTQLNKSKRITGGISALAVTLGGGLISQFANSPEPLTQGIGWGILLTGCILLLIKVVLDT